MVFDLTEQRYKELVHILFFTEKTKRKTFVLVVCQPFTISFSLSSALIKTYNISLNLEA